MEIKRIEEFLVNFGKDITKNVIECHSGDLSIICNPDTEWKEFMGCSVFGVVKHYCELSGKTCHYLDDNWGWVDEWDEDYLDSEEDI